MIILLLLTFLLGLLPESLQAQYRRINRKTLSTQAELTAFAARYSYGYTGELTIKSTGITDLSPLAGFTLVQGDLTIEGTNLTSLAGLSSLQKVTGSLEILSNRELTSLNGLTALQEVGERIRIYGNGKLTDISGLTALTKVNGFIKISANYSLLEIDGFPKLKTIAWGLQISDNLRLTSIKGFPVLTTIGGQGPSRNLAIVHGLSITDNKALINIQGFPALTTINGALFLHECPLTGDLSAFPKLTTLDKLMITHTNLRHIDFIYGLTSIEEITIQYNHQLTNLNGLSSVKSMPNYIGSNVKYPGKPGKNMLIRYNASLNNYCGLYYIQKSGFYTHTGVYKANTQTSKSHDRIGLIKSPCPPPPPPPCSNPTINTITPTHETCAGKNNGQLLITATGSGPLDYSKDGGLTWQTGRRFTRLSDGDYPIMVRLRSDPTCKTSVQTATVSPGPARTTATATATPAGCPGDIDGTITLSATGTTGTLSYVLGSDPSVVNFTAGTSHTIPSLPAGRYRFRVYDAANAACPSKPVRVRVEASKQQPTFDLSVIQPPIRPGSGPEQYLGEDKLFLTFKGVTVAGPPTGTIPAHKYAMTPPGSTTPNAYVSVATATKTEGQNAFFEVPGASTPGTYTFTIKDPNGCESEPQSITLNDPAVCNATANTSREDVNTKFRASHGSDNRLWQHVYQGGTYQQRYRVRNLTGGQQLKLDWALVSLTEADAYEGITYNGSLPDLQTVKGTDGPFINGIRIFDAGGAIWGREDEAEKKATATFKLIPILVLSPTQQCYGEPVEKKMIIRPVPQLSLANATQPGQTISIPSGGDPNGKISLEIVNPIQENTEVQLLYAVEIAQNPSIVELSAGGVSIPHYKQIVGPTPPKYPANTSSDLAQPFDPFQALADERSINTFTLAAGVTDPVRVRVTITPISFPIPAVTEEEGLR